jgi:DNA polymerase III subunit gamma/tau
MYQAIARRWRPQQFDEVIGQNHITTTLVNAITKNRIGHAYLFVGPRGIGKTTLARILAKGLNCLSSDQPTPQPCDKCESCLDVIAGNCLDVMEIDGASNTSVDDIRELRENVKYAPARGRNKIYIIDEVHMLSKNAFNALLKTLEEPPAHVKFFFATTEPHKIPDTIISRCQRFDLRKIPSQLIREHLGKILEKESVDCDEKALRTIAAVAEGGMRDAESILDQLLVYCDEKIQQEDVAALLGLVPSIVVSEFAQAILAGDLSNIIRLVNETIDQGWDLKQFLSTLIRHFRDLLVLSIPGADEKITDIPVEEARELAELGRKFTTPRLLFILDELIEGENKIKYAISEQIALEMMLINIAKSRGRIYLDELITRIEAIQSGLPDIDVIPESTQTSPEEYMVQETEDPRHSSISEIWSEFMETLGENRPMLKAYLMEGTPGEVEDGILTIFFNEEFDFHREALETPDKQSFMETLLTNKLGIPIKLKFVVRKATRKEPDRKQVPPPTTGKNKSLIRNNPIIESAIDIFDASIEEVRE